MLPGKYRLPLRTELKRVKATGKLVHGRLFSLLIAPQILDSKSAPPSASRRILATHGQIPNSRFAFIISSRVHKRAVKRNRAKRLLNEAVYSLIGKIKPGFETVFLVKKTIIGEELREIRDEVKRVFKKAGLLIF